LGPGTISAIPAAQSSSLIEQGPVAIVPIVNRASYGQVRVKLHSEPEGDD
jgi:hypothetical protein